MSRKTDAVLIFDEHVSGTGNHYTRAEFNTFLGAFDKYAFHMIASASGAATNITGQLEQGSDGLTFQNKNGAAELPSTALSTSAPTNLMGADAGTIVGQGFGRLRVALSVNTSARVKIWAVGRDL